MTNPIISKDHFIACIKVMQEADDMARRINVIVREYGRGDFIDGYAFSNFDTEVKLIQTLEMAFEDTYHWISWFCIEADYGRNSDLAANVNWNGKSYNLSSVEALYDFLTES
jgi:hypothetical protein